MYANAITTAGHKIKKSILFFSVLPQYDSRHKKKSTKCWQLWTLIILPSLVPSFPTASRFLAAYRRILSTYSSSSLWKIESSHIKIRATTRTDYGSSLVVSCSSSSICVCVNLLKWYKKLLPLLVVVLGKKWSNHSIRGCCCHILVCTLWQQVKSGSGDIEDNSTRRSAYPISGSDLIRNKK